MNNTPPCRFDLTFIVLGITNLSTIQPRNIVEIGSRDGYDVNFISDHFNIPKKDCIVFEPNPNSCEEIMRSYPDLTILNNAISSNTTTRDFFIDDKNVGCCSLLKKTGVPLTSIKVDCVDMLTVINNLNLTYIDICKIDTEGTTLDVLESFREKLEIVKSIQLESETSPSWENQSLYPDVKEFLESRGFVEVLFCRLHGKQIDSFWIQKPYLSIQ